MIIDDPLSALDNEVADKIIQELKYGCCKDKTRLVVTHKKELVRLADKVFFMEAGKDTLLVYDDFIEEYFKNTSTFVAGENSDKGKEGNIKEKTEAKTSSEDANIQNLLNVASGITKKNFIQAVRDMEGEYWLPLIFILVLSASFTEPISIKYLLNWAQNFEKSTRWSHLAVLTSLYAIKSFIPPLRRVLLFLVLQNKVSTKIHSRMLLKVLHAGLHEFHEKIPSGLVVNRMSGDLPKVDNRLVDSFGMLMNLVSIMTYLFLMILVTIHWTSILFVALFLLLMIKLQRSFIEIRRTLVKSQSASMTPVLDHLEDTISDLTALRALGLEQLFFARYKYLLESLFDFSYLLSGFNIWFNSIMSISSILIVQVPCLLILLIFYSDNMDWNNIVVFVVLVGNLAGDLQRFLFFLTDFDGCFVDLDRCYFFDKIENEPGVIISSPEFKTFESGNLTKINNYILNCPQLAAVPYVKEISFKDVSAGYTTSKLTLRDLNCVIPEHAKIGIVGRTGSGKSTLVKLLWRYLKQQQGSICMNGVDTRKHELRELRQSLCVLSQESHILTGNLRFNLDPKGSYSDIALLKTLEDIGFSNPGFEKSKLDFELTEDGKNLSVGEKQLICLARVLLSKASVVILDEATASMDHKLDKHIKTKIYEKFGGVATIIIVAHRIDTVLDCDKILAFSDGKLIEEGSPAQLLQNKESYLSRVIGQE